VTRFQACAGFSIGEFTALCAAGVFTYEDGLKLVQLLGEAMQEVATTQEQLKLSVAGLEKSTLEKLCKESVDKERGLCQITEELFPRGFICGGTDKAVMALKNAAETAGALQTRFLRKSLAYHTELVGPARDQLSKALDEALPRMSPPMHIVYMNATAQPLKVGTDPKEIIELLKRQVTSPVFWEPLVRNMIEAGITEFYEVGPLKQLKAMMKRIDQKAWNSTSNVEV